MTKNIYDVAIIGAGAVGTAIARELSRYELSAVLLEANPDVGQGTTKANTAIWHTGFDARNGTLEAKLLRRSYPLMEKFIEEAGIPVERLGGLLVAWTEEQREILPSLQEKAFKNGVMDVKILSAEEVYQLEPNLHEGAWGGLYVPGESILCPFTIPIALATQAVLNGVELRVDFPVRAVHIDGDGTKVVEGPNDTVRCRYLVNAAGLYSDEIDRMLGHRDFTVTPRRGELIVFDKFARSLINHIILPVPTPVTKGVLISPTVYGNVLLGPTAEDLDDKTNTATSEAGLQALLEKGRSILPALLDEEVTATYAGLRAATDPVYQIRLHPEQNYVTVGGIRSTGVSASMGIAEYVRDLLVEGGLALVPKREFKPVKMPYIGAAAPRPYQRPDMIARNPDYGKIVCYCEKVSLGEIMDAIHSPVPARTLDGLRRRTRAMQGRCQGFNCRANIVDILARETGQDPKFLLALDDMDISRNRAPERSLRGGGPK